MKNRHLSEHIKKQLILLCALFVLIMSVSFRANLAADEIEEWEESGTIQLQKVTYDTRTRKMTVEIKETSGKLAYEYELYMLVEGELADYMGQFMHLGKLLSILGIMTVDVNDKIRIIEKGNGEIDITDQEIYFGSNDEVTSGTRVYIGVESLDSNYTPSKSNLIEMNIVDGLNEEGAMFTQNGNSNTSNSNTGTGSNNLTDPSGNKGGGSGILIGGILGLILLGGGAFVLLKGKGKPVKKAKEKIKEEAEKEKDDFSPSLEDKTVVVCTKSEELLKTLKDRHYLSVTQCEEDEIDEAVEENEPDILITDLNTEEQLDELLTKKDDNLADVALGLHVNDELLPSIRSRLENLLEDKVITGFVPFSAGAYDTLVKLILPILKPNLKSDESLDNIAQVADLLGIPGVSTIINLYVSGRDIKANLEEGELGVSQSAAIIGDIASIMGLDTVASVAGLVDDVDSIKSAFDEEAGANENKNAVLGAKDIVDVVKDLTDKG
ncbi:MAG: hypothetical protein IK151_03855 [Erysipelotrichaceae bacterium]|nr:hypothetical protein [Erysipelotrichaceae bacterium]